MSGPNEDRPAGVDARFLTEAYVSARLERLTRAMPAMDDAYQALVSVAGSGLSNLVEWTGFDELHGHYAGCIRAELAGVDHAGRAFEARDLLARRRDLIADGRSFVAIQGSAPASGPGYVVVDMVEWLLELVGLRLLLLDRLLLNHPDVRNDPA